MIAIKELHGDLFEEGTEFRIADNFGDDPDAVWISRQDFEMLKARPVDMLSRTFFLYYKGDERKRIVIIDPELKQGQIKLNKQDYEYIVLFRNDRRTELWMPYQLLPEQYLIFEELDTDHTRTKRYTTTAEGKRYYTKLLMFYHFMYIFNFLAIRVNPVEMTDACMITRILLQMTYFDRRVFDENSSNRRLKRSWCNPCWLIRTMNKVKTIPLLGSIYWEELKELREYFIRGYSVRKKLKARVDVILTMWENNVDHEE